MNMLECTWTVRQSLNKVLVTGIAPVINELGRPVVERILILAALNFIKKAKESAECIVLAQEPENIILPNAQSVAVSFTLLFKEIDKANEYAKTLKS